MGLVFMKEKKKKELIMQERIGKWIAAIHRQEQRFICHAMEPCGLGFPEYIFLYGISRHEGCIQKELSRAQRMDSAMVTRSIHKLEEQGYLCREKPEPDKRAWQLYLTEKGRALLPRLEKAMDCWQETITREMDDSQKALLLSLLRRAAELGEEANQSAAGAMKGRE